MSVHRAICACPVCNEETEVWFYKSKIEPIDTIHCIKCSKKYDASNFIVKLLELYNNKTVSSYSTLHS